MNVVALIGRLAEDPELRHTQNDTAVTSFAVAVDRGYSKGSERILSRWLHGSRRLSLFASIFPKGR